MSYYEVVADGTTRFQDQEWHTMLYGDAAPPRPGWTDAFLVGSE